MLPHSSSAHREAPRVPVPSGSPEACAVAWTGRSALSVATETGLSRFATSGSRCTRVSALRASVPRAAGRASHARRTGAPVTRRRIQELSPPRG